MEAKRLVILVEGDSELMFMKQQVIPELYARSKSSWSIETCKIITNRKLNKKGGNINYDYLCNDVARFAAQGCTVITTFLDFFRLPITFPGYTTDGKLIHQVEAAMETDMRKRIPTLSQFVPYIQKHEFEALLFSGTEGFNYLLDEESQLERIEEIMTEFPCPEDINGGATTAPSKRLMAIFNYDKTADSSDILELIGFDTIYSKCPRFSSWFDNLVDAINN